MQRMLWFMLNGRQIYMTGLNKKKEIIELQQKIDKVLLADFPKDKKFHPHITLARVKFIENKKEFINKLKGMAIEKKKNKVKNFKLIKSTLTSNGPIYEELAEFLKEKFINNPKLEIISGDILKFNPMSRRNLDIGFMF